MWQIGHTNRSSKKGLGRVQIGQALHLHRVAAEVRIAPRLGEIAEVLAARVVLHDFSPDGVGFFAKASVEPGTELAITMDHPTRIYIKCRVTGCQERENSNAVISPEAHPFRLRVKFIFQSDDERRAMVAFCEEVMRRTFPDAIWKDEVPSKAAAAESPSDPAQPSALDEEKEAA